jgi:hemerythrin-like domain-containing protein
MIRLTQTSRRGLVAGLAGAPFVIAGRAALSADTGGKPEKQEKEVGAVEDLMREHGVLRRCLMVYSETAAHLRAGDRFDPQPVRRAAELFRRFGEGYHEMMLEEMHIFPQVKQAGGEAAALVDVLKAQHERGREITAYTLQVLGKGAVGTGDAEPLARALDNFVRMYRAHAAREDTVVFPAWKESLSEQQLHEMGERFEDIERQTFGHDGFEDAVKQIADIEKALGLADLAKFTAPPPTKA